jgi:hypothetical protein
MKTRKKSGKGLYSQKRNNRWKWMAGATAAGVTASQASAITINLVGNYIGASGGNHLNADLTGDGHPDLTITGAFAAGPVYATFRSGPFSYAGVNLNGVVAYAFLHTYDRFGTARLGSRYAYEPLSSAAAYLMGAIPIFFKDLHINGGKPTAGSLEVTVSAGDRLHGSPTIQLDDLTYNTPGQQSSLSVPDHGSSLALLAMGAGGILALRRWRAAQRRP